MAMRALVREKLLVWKERVNNLERQLSEAERTIETLKITGTGTVQLARPLNASRTSLGNITARSLGGH